MRQLALPNYDKARVAQQFGRAAAHYTDHDRLQREVASVLYGHLQGQVHTLIDIGCGPGHHFPQLQHLAKHYLGLDLAPQMLARAQQSYPHAEFLLADMEALPLANHSVDCLYSNLAMQWANHPKQLLAEWWRVLAPGGQWVTSTVLAGSLAPLTECFAMVDEVAHHNHWPELRDYQNWSAEAAPGLQWQQQTFTQYFTSLEEMLRELKGVGANYTVRPEQGCYSRQRLARVREALEKHRNSEGLLELTWQIGIAFGCK